MTRLNLTLARRQRIHKGSLMAEINEPLNRQRAQSIYYGCLGWIGGLLTALVFMEMVR